jgi:hypothetical protein
MQRVASPRQAGASLRDRWFDSRPGQRLLAWERRVVIPKLTTIYGCNGLYLRPSGGVAAELSGNMLQCVISLQRDSQGFSGQLCCDDDALPIAAESLSLIYAQHVFESSRCGAELAREVSQALAPEGSLLVMLLNSLSPWRLSWRGQGMQPVSETRVRQWLEDAGLQLHATHGAGPLLPWCMSNDEEGERQRLELAGLRAAKLLVFRKHRPAMTPLRARSAIRFATQPGPG